MARVLIHARTGEGRAGAKANGVRLGRKPILTPHQRQEAKRRVNARKESVGEIARSYDVSPWTIQRLDLGRKMIYAFGEDVFFFVEGDFVATVVGVAE